MAIVSGDVNVTIRIDGAGDGARVTDASAASLKRLGAEATTMEKKLSNTVTQQKSLSASFDEGIKPANAMRERFEKLRSNATFLVGGILAVATALGGFVTDIMSAHSAVGQLNRRMEEFGKAGDGVRAAIDMMREKLGQIKDKSGDVWNQGIIDASNLRLQVDMTNEALGANLRKVVGLREEYARLTDPANKFRLTNEVTGSGLAGVITRLNAAESLQNKLLQQRADVTKQILEFERLTLEYVQAQSLVIAKMVAGRVSPLAALGFTVQDTAAGEGPPPRNPGAGGGHLDPRKALGKALEKGDQKAIDAAFAASNDRGIPAANDNTLDWTLTQADALAKSTEQVQSYADAFERLDLSKDIRDFTTALNEALPGMGAFNTALSQLAETWTKWGEGSLTTRDAVVGSLGAIAKAGAQQIKDERLRAGILSIIELGLGFATLATPPIAAGHFAAAGILGSVAIFGSGSGSSRGAGGAAGGAGAPRPVRLGGEMLGQRAVNVTIQNYYGGRSEQEAGADFTRLVRRVRGTGHEEGRDAA